MRKISVRTFVAIGIGAALFFVLGRFVTIPVFANTSINIQYAFLAFMAVLYGPIAGCLIGLIGHMLIDFTTYGPWWSWIIASAVVGGVVGIIGQKINIENGEIGKVGILTFNIANVVANAVAWFLIAPVLDIAIYKEPASKVFTQGFIAGISNIITTAIIGTLLLYAYSKTKTKEGSLRKEN